MNKKGRPRSPNGESTITRDNLEQQLQVTLTPHRQLQIQLSGVHFYNQIQEKLHKHLFLADVQLTYTFTSGVELSLIGHNLFNQASYSYTSYGTLTTTSQNYHIRPRDLILGLFFRL